MYLRLPPLPSPPSIISTFFRILNHLSLPLALHWQTFRLTLPIAGRPLRVRALVRA